ncbi:MAG: methionyl-tRNA formyltransferase [Pseudomonadota bacterium]
MRIIFMGTPEFAVPSLATLIANGYDVVAVYTQPPRPAGRGHKITSSPVHQFADQHGIEVQTPLSFKGEADRTAFADLQADIGIVVAYGLILPQAILDAPTHGCLNIHGSLLPRWRGAAPVQRAIMAGDPQTGVQVMQMEKGLDTGPVLLSETVPITPQDTASSLTDKLSHIGAELLPRTLAALGRGGLVPHPQSEEGVTYAEKINSEEARVDWSRSGAEIDHHIRGLSPFPGAWSTLTHEGKEVRLKLLFSSVHKEPAPPNTAPGTIMYPKEGELGVVAGDGTIVQLHRLQRPGKAVQDAEIFLRGFSLAPGIVLQ